MIPVNEPRLTERDYAAVMDAILRAEREQCPEVLLNLTLGPSEGGDFAEVQLYADRAACEAFGARVQREVPALQSLWEQHSPLVEPEACRSTFFEANEHLLEAFLRARANTIEGGKRNAKKQSVIFLARSGLRSCA